MRSHPLKVTIDERVIDVAEGMTADRALEKAGEPNKGCVLAVRKKVAVEKVATDLYSIETTKGKLIMRIECQGALSGWRRHYKSFEGTSVRWSTRDATVFGQITTDFEPSDEQFEMRKNEVALSLSGFSNESTHIVFGKKTHTGNYSPPKGCGVIGRVVYGRHLIENMTMGDRILKVEPIIETKETAKSVLKIDGNYALEDGDSIITKMSIEMVPSSPVASEHIYNVLGKGWMEVGSKTSRFISDNRFGIASLGAEGLGVRRRGTLTVRNTGSNAGGIYVFTSEAPLSPSHSIAGRVISGMELADVSERGDRIVASILQERIDLLGMTQSEAGALLVRQGIRVERLGDRADSAIIVEQSPSNSLEISAKKEVFTTGVGQEKIVKVRLYSKDAPASVRYFKVVTGLELRRFGKLKTYFSTPKMELVLFRGNDAIAKGLMPENIPSTLVRSGQIGVTNTVKKFTGMIGIRFIDSDNFGPTAEAFDGTNLIGEVVGNTEALRALKEGAEIYLMEAQG